MSIVHRLGYQMSKIAVSRIKYYKKSGARLYIPQSVIEDPDFRFNDGDIVKIEINNPAIIISRPEWWEMLDWTEMSDTYALLPQEVRDKIRESGLAPI